MKSKITIQNNTKNIFTKIKNWYLVKFKQEKLSEDFIENLKLHNKFDKELSKELQLTLK